MKVHVVIGTWVYDGQEIIGVYKDKTKADNKLKKLQEDAEKKGRRYWYDEYHVESHHLR